MEIASICRRRLGGLLPRWISHSLPRLPEAARALAASVSKESRLSPTDTSTSISIARKAHGGGIPRRSRAESPGPRATVKPLRPLRVFHVIDDAATPTSRGTGRIVISGRMADVCAELDRLAAIESRRGCA